MTTTRRLLQLFQALARNDLPSAKAVAAQIAVAEANKGHRTAARLLRGALNASPNGSHSVASHLAPETAAISNGNVLSTALVRVTADVLLNDVILSRRVQKQLEEFVFEWKHRGKLRVRGLTPRSKLLFHGPPGCGKSLTAQALGVELGLPVYMVRFDAVIGAFLGQTAIHLRQLFHFAEVTPCVLLLDELDALGKRRGNPLDVGELDRIVISLMQELEHSKPAGVIIGTSNLPRHLDDALWRRFDLDVVFPPPTQRALSEFLRNLTIRKKVSIPNRVRRGALESASFAAAEAVVMAEVRRQALADGVKGR